MASPKIDPSDALATAVFNSTCLGVLAFGAAVIVYVLRF